MNDMSARPSTASPSAATLLKATGIAFVVAALVLILFVLPAEYGVDPTGIGARLGLTAMNAPQEDVDATETSSSDAIVSSAVTPISVLDAAWKAEQPFRTDEMSLTLGPNEGGEIKALMQVGERLVFTWTSEGGGVSFDMHGEALNAAKDEFTSYWKGRNESSGHGAFQAPFAGTHGWYWRNRGSSPVTVRVKTSGYYEKLFKP
jgi:hypothetical protein